MQSQGGRTVIRGLAALILFLSAASASACSCAYQTLGDFVKEADVIYLATLTEAKFDRGVALEKWPRIVGRFEIRKLIKGEVREKSVTLQTGLGRGDCGVSMSVSENYLIFKDKDSDGISMCSGSGMIYEFQEQELLAKIDALMRKPVKQINAGKPKAKAAE
jgi:hypothetical protein